jgi:hypothetical protein
MQKQKLKLLFIVAMFLLLPSFVHAAPQVLLTTGILDGMRQKALANDPQWTTLKGDLDVNLNSVINRGEYQGSHLTWLSNYALGYQVLKDSDPTTAAKYADKAIGIMQNTLTGYLKSGQETRQFLGRGDGVTKTFTLPDNANIADLRVYLSNITTVPVVHSNLHGEDPSAQYYSTFIKVSNTNDGTADYAMNTDWKHSSNSNQNVDWSMGGLEPAQGATYYLTLASLGGTNTSVTLVGNQITFATAPAINKAILVEYIYGAHAGDCSTLAYQTTNANDGGFDSIIIDTTYPSRYLGKHMAMAYDWLYDYPCFSSPAKAQTESMLIRWSDYVRDNGYLKNSIGSNYAAGGYVSRMLTAVALENRSTASARLKSEMQSYHNNYVTPLFVEPANGIATLKGGYWDEGWNYGPLAIRNIIIAAKAFEIASWGIIDGEKSWSDEVIKALLTDQSIQASIYPGGDIYAWPMPFPNKILLAVLANVNSDATLKSYANWAIQNYASSFASDEGWENLIFHDTAAVAVNWGNNLPLQYLSTGVGHASIRKDWNYNSTWLGFLAGNIHNADHQDAQGILSISRGADDLLPLMTSKAQAQSFQDKSKYGNLVAIDDGGAGEQNYRYAQGIWYGNPGVRMLNFEGDAEYSYAKGDYAAAYNKAGTVLSPATELMRSIFYLRNHDYVFIQDKATTTHANYLKQLQWHFLSAPTINGNSWIETVGSSKLFAATFSDSALSTSLNSVTINTTTVPQISTNNSAPANSVHYLTAMQIAPSSTNSMDQSGMLTSNSNTLEGMQLGSAVVMFVKTNSFSGGDYYSLNIANGVVVDNYIIGLTAGTYTLAGANESSATTSAQGVLKFTTTGTGLLQNVTVNNLILDITAPAAPSGLSVM